MDAHIGLPVFGLLTNKQLLKAKADMKMRQLDFPIPDDREKHIAFLAEQAARTKPTPGYLDKQNTVQVGAVTLRRITVRQREKVVKYLGELADDFEFEVSVGTIAVNIFDRYLAHIYTARDKDPDAGCRELAEMSCAKKTAKRVADGELTQEQARSYMLNVSKDDLLAERGEMMDDGTAADAHRSEVQMIATTCLLISAKFNSRKLPPLSELHKVHHGKVYPFEFADLELRMLKALDWNIHVITPKSFIFPILALCTEDLIDADVHERMEFFIDLSVYMYNLLPCPPAAVAAVSLLIAWKFSDFSEDYRVALCPPFFARVTGVATEELNNYGLLLMKFYREAFASKFEEDNETEKLKTVDKLIETEERQLELQKQMQHSLSTIDSQKQSRACPTTPRTPTGDPRRVRQRLNDAGDTPIR
tara:strand:+ start:407 stop:1663 length:1257 start_codon:yes stop_codon:yes gene_type:complete